MSIRLLIVLLLGGCFASHTVLPDHDAEADAGALDAGRRDAVSIDVPMDAYDAGAAREIVFDVPAQRLAGARWGRSTSLVVSYERRVDAPIEVWTFDTPTPDLPLESAQVVRTTTGSDVAAAARWEDHVAIAVDRAEGPHDIVLFDIRTGRNVARWVFDPTLMRPRVLHAYVAIDATRVLVIWLDPESVTRFAVGELATGEMIELTSGTAGTNSLSAAVRLAASDPIVSELLEARLGDAFDIVESRLDVSWVADGNSVAAYDRRRLLVDGEVLSEDPPEFTTIYGRMTYARGDDDALIGLATGSGMLAATIDADRVSWTTLASRWPAGSPVAHAGTVRGLFFVEGAIGFQPARLRWIELE